MVFILDIIKIFAVYAALSVGVVMFAGSLVWFIVQAHRTWRAIWGKE